MTSKMRKVSKAILITGCSTGIGRATAERLVGAGWTVYATARRPETLTDLQGLGCHTLPLDVDDEHSMAAAVAAVERAEGAVGVLINNAGYCQSGAIESVPMDLVRKQFETNVFGLARMCQLALPGMRKQCWGKIINVSSMGGKLTFPGSGFYHATKHAVEALSDVLRFEAKGFGVDVVVIQPGLIRTEFDKAVGASVGALQESAGPYLEFNAAVARATQEAYVKGPLAKLGGGPDVVAKAIERALTAAKPRTRYSVTPSAKLLLRQRAMLSDRMWDAFLRFSFPLPVVS